MCNLPILRTKICVSLGSPRLSTYMNVFLCMCVCVCECVCVYTHIHSHTHTHIYFNYKELAHTIMLAEKLRHPVNKLETQESQWCDSVLSPKTWGWGELMVWIVVCVQVQSQEKTNVPAQKPSGRRNCFLLRGKSDILSYSGLQPVRWDLSILGRTIRFILPINMLILSRNTQNNVRPNIWAPRGPIKLSHNNNHHKGRPSKWGTVECGAVGTDSR